jgi:MFS family permease
MSEKETTISQAPSLENEHAAAPTGVKALIQERHIVGLASFCCIGGFLYGYNLGVFGGILVMNNFQKAFPSINNSSMQGLVSSILNLGAWLGTIENGWASERMGRRRSITFACIFFVLGVALQAGAQNPAYHFVGRFLAGFGVGALSVATALYNSEIAPTSIRGSLGSLFQFSCEIGTLVAFWVDFGTNKYCIVILALTSLITHHYIALAAAVTVKRMLHGVFPSHFNSSLVSSLPLESSGHPSLLDGSSANPEKRRPSKN